MCVTDTDRQSDGLKRCGARLAIRPDDQAVAGRRYLKAVEAALEVRHPTRRATAQRRHPHRVLAAVVAAVIDQVANNLRVALVDIGLRRQLDRRPRLTRQVPSPTIEAAEIGFRVGFPRSEEHTSDT